MAELCGGLRFANEALANIRVERQIRRENFDRNRAIQAEIRRQVHHGHPAAPNLSLDEILSANSSRHTVAKVVIHTSARRGSRR
jgi:hypothetical protein